MEVWEGSKGSRIFVVIDFFHPWLKNMDGDIIETLFIIAEDGYFKRGENSVDSTNNGIWVENYRITRSKALEMAREYLPHGSDLIKKIENYKVDIPKDSAKLWQYIHDT